MNQILTKYSKELIIIALIAICLISMRKCSENKNQLIQADKNAFNLTKGFEKIVNEQGETIAVQDQIIVNKNSKLVANIEEIEGLRKIKQQVKVETQTVIKNIEIPIDRPIYIFNNDSTKKYLQVPASFSKQEKWFSQTGSITEKGIIHIDSLTFKSEPIISIGLRKKKALKSIFTKPEPVVSYKDNNPFAQVKSMSNITVENSVHRKFGIGLTVGYGVGNSGLSPIIGIGIQYRLITF